MSDRILDFIKFLTGALLSAAFTIFVVYLSYKAALAAFSYGHGVGESMVAEKPSKEVTIMLANTSSISDVARILKANGVIGNPYLYMLDSYLNGSPQSFSPGTYTVNTNMSDIELNNALSANNSITVAKIIISEGFTISNIGKYLENKEIVSSADFIAACDNSSFNYDFLAGLPDGPGRLEGFLFPDTYFIAKDASPEEIINKMLARFDQIYTPEYRRRARDLNLTDRQLVTVASLVQDEAGPPKECPAVAGVIYNRLRLGMCLNLATPLTYALNTREENLTDADFAKATPYNTFVNKGLPPGPVSNPGLAAIKGALFPADTGAAYMVIKDAKTREHLFTDSADEYAAALKQYDRKY